MPRPSNGPRRSAACRATRQRLCPPPRALRIPALDWSLPHPWCAAPVQAMLAPPSFPPAHVWSLSRQLEAVGWLPSGCGCSPMGTICSPDDLRDLRRVRLVRGVRVRLHRHHVPPGGRAGHGADRLQPAGGAQRLPAPHRRRAHSGPHPRQPVLRGGLRAPDRERALAERRRLGLLLGRRPADPGCRRVPVRRCRRGRDPDRSAAHPRGATADPLHAQGRHLRGAGLGGRRRAQPLRRLRPGAGQRRTRALQADRRRRGQLRRRVRLGLPGPPGRAEVRP